MEPSDVVKAQWTKWTIFPLGSKTETVELEPDSVSFKKCQSTQPPTMYDISAWKKFTVQYSEKNMNTVELKERECVNEGE